MVKDLEYCPKCGASLSEGAEYCPDCGNALRSVSGGADDPSLVSRTKIVGIFCLIFTVGAIIVGIYFAGSADAFINSMKNDNPDGWAELVKQMADAGYTAQQFEDLLRTSFALIGGFFIVSGAVVAVGGVCSLTRKLWIIGLICLIIGTVLMSVTIIGLVCGIIFTVLYAKCKPVFT